MLAATQLFFLREKPKIIKASQKKSSRSDEPDAKRRKVDVNETTIVQKVTLCLF